MKSRTAIRISLAAFSLVLLIPEITAAQAAPNTQQNANGIANSANNSNNQAQMEASEMRPAQAALDRTLDTRKDKPGEQFRAKLANKVQLKNGPELPAGTILEGTIGTDDMQQQGTSKMALCIDKAQLKNGTTVAVKATIIGIYGPGAGGTDLYPITYGDQVPNDWNRQVYAVDELGALPGVDLHSKITSRNSGVLVSTKKDDMKLHAGTELALAIAPATPGPQSSNTH